MDTNESGVVDLMASNSAAAINEYLSLMEESEAPRQYVIWSLLAASAGLIGRNAAFRRGPLYSMTANLFVVLLGPAGLRKSSAITQVMNLLQDTTINFGPTDTGGQRHGIMSALVGSNRFNPGKRWTNEKQIPGLFDYQIKPRPPSDLFLSAPELGRLLGIGSREMADFFVDLWDGARIDYETKASETIIARPLVTMLGATTPTSLASILPDGATGHGILSRILFVWADERHKDVPIPPIPGEDWYDKRDSFQERLTWIDQNRLDFAFSGEAEKLYESLYTYNPKIADPRLEHYKERRSGMVLKVAMCLCALRMSVIICEDDVNLAHQLLTLIEPMMHKSLEYFGKNKAFVGRMLILQYLRAQTSFSANKSQLVAAAMSELNKREADEAIESMIASKELAVFGDVIALGEIVESIKGMGKRK